MDVCHYILQAQKYVWNVTLLLNKIIYFLNNLVFCIRKIRSQNIFNSKTLYSNNLCEYLNNMLNANKLTNLIVFQS
jgi:hypothetical protein